MRNIFATLLCCGLMAGCSTHPPPELKTATPVPDLKVEATLQTRLIAELAKANGVSVGAFDSDTATLVPADTGYTLEFSHQPSEGTESCKGRYTKDGTLLELECLLELVSHSMGGEIARTDMKASRAYDSAGSITKVAGNFKQVRLKTKTVVANRKLKSKDDEALELLAKPLLKIPGSILDLLKPKD